MVVLIDSLSITDGQLSLDGKFWNSTDLHRSVWEMKLRERVSGGHVLLLKLSADAGEPTRRRTNLSFLHDLTAETKITQLGFYKSGGVWLLSLIQRQTKTHSYVHETQTVSSHHLIISAAVQNHIWRFHTAVLKGRVYIWKHLMQNHKTYVH